MSVNFSHVCIIYVKIYEKMSSGGLEVSLSIVTEYAALNIPYLDQCCFFCLRQYEIVLGRDRCLLSQGHNLYKLNYISLEEVKIENFQQKVTY